MSESVHPWLDQAVPTGGVMACAVKEADRSVALRSSKPEVAEVQLGEMMQSLAETLHTLHQNRVAAQFLCWTFENGQIRCVLREDGAIAAVLACRGEEAAQEADQLLALFLQPAL